MCVHVCIRCLHIGKCLRSRLKCFRKKGLENEIGIIHKIYYVDPACSMQESVISFKELYSKCKFCFTTLPLQPKSRPKQITLGVSYVGNHSPPLLRALIHVLHPYRFIFCRMPYKYEVLGSNIPFCKNI